jgi:hypothetical protein
MNFWEAFFSGVEAEVWVPSGSICLLKQALAFDDSGRTIFTCEPSP